MRLKGMLVADLMSTALLTLKAKDTVTRADFDMKLAHIRHMPVVDDHNHVIGILSNRDVFRALGNHKQAAIPVSEVMTHDPITVSPNQPAYEAASLMLDNKIGALPVVGEEEQLVGLVTESDFLEIAVRALSP